MKIAIESTGKVTSIEGVPVRLWEGVTERGTKCQVFVHRIAVHESQDSSQFDQELKECLPPGTFIPLRHIL